MALRKMTVLLEEFEQTGAFQAVYATVLVYDFQFSLR